MATPVPTLVGSIEESSSDGTIAIPNTTPPAVGNFLIAFLAAYQSGGSRTITTAPAGWASLQDQGGDDHPYRVYTKTAEAGDVSASDFTFVLDNFSDCFTGAIIKVSNNAAGSDVAGSEEDLGTTSYTFTTNLTPTTAESIIIAFYTDAQNSTGGGTISGYASTPSLTWTELADVPGNNGSPSLSFAIAYAPITGLTNITQRTATQSTTPGQAKSVALIINGLQNATGTNALLAVSPTHLNQAGVAGASGTSALYVAPSPTFFDQSGQGTTPTVWRKPTKSSTTWTNETL